MSREFSAFLKQPSFKLYSRNTSLFMSFVFAHFGMKTLFDNYGFQVPTLTIYEKGFIDCYALDKDIVDIRKIIINKVESSNNFEDFFGTKAFKSFKYFQNLTGKLERKYLETKAFNKMRVENDYVSFLDALYDLQAHAWFNFFYDLVNDWFAKKEINPLFQKSKLSISKNEFYQVISTPLRKSAVTEERIEFLRLAIKHFRGANISQELIRHYNQWRWFPCYNPCDKPYLPSHYTKELRLLTAEKAEKELREILSKWKSDIKQYKNLTARIQSEKLRRFIDYFNKTSYYREYRNDLRREGLCKIQPLFMVIAKCFNFTLKELCYLAPQEIHEALQKGQIPVSRKEIKDRMLSHVFYGDKDSYELIIGKQTKKYYAYFKSKKKIISLSGISASPGKIVGRAMVINEIGKLKNFKKGAILVASMTAPDYIMAMRRAKAIVTDDGGLTSHAAIISRELRIPCIVGTKTATKVLIDGDLLEVDAGKGIIKLLEK